MPTDVFDEKFEGPHDARAKKAEPSSVATEVADGPETSQDLSAVLPSRPRIRWLAVLTTIGIAIVASYATYIAWQNFMGTPWTRDATVRVYVVSMASEVSGRVVSLPVKDNQFVRAGDLLMKIDPRDYKIAVDLAQAKVDQASADLENKKILAARRLQFSTLAVSREEQGTFVTSAKMAEAALQQDRADLDRALTNLQRIEIRSPVNGWVTNLQTRVGDYADKGQRSLSIVDAGSFWIDGYFEETQVGQIKVGDPVKAKLMGYDEVIGGHVESVAHGININNAQPDSVGLAQVDPIFTWVRLAQRVPVRVALDQVPADIRLVAGMTATLQVETLAGCKPTFLRFLHISCRSMAGNINRWHL